MDELAIKDPTVGIVLNNVTGQPRRQVHVHFSFEAYVIGNPNLRKAIYDNVIQHSNIFKGRTTNLDVKVVDRNPNTKPARVKLVSVSVDFDTWTVLDPKQFGKVGTPLARERGSFWITANLGIQVQSTLSSIRDIRNRRNFKINTSGEWEEAHLA